MEAAINSYNIEVVEKYFKKNKYHIFINFNTFPDNRFIERVIYLYDKWCEYPKLSANHLINFIVADHLYKFKAAETIIRFDEYYGKTLLDFAIKYNATKIFTYLIPRYLQSYKYYKKKLLPALKFMDSHAAAIITNAGITFQCSIDNILKLSYNREFKVLFKLLNFKLPDKFYTPLITAVDDTYPHFINMVINYYNLDKISSLGKVENANKLIHSNITRFLWNKKDAERYIRNSIIRFNEVACLNRFNSLSIPIPSYDEQIINTLNLRLIKGGILKYLTAADLNYYSINSYNINFTKLCKYNYLAARRDVLIKLFFKVTSLDELCDIYIRNQYSPFLKYLMNILQNKSSSSFLEYVSIVRDKYREIEREFKKELIKYANMIICKPGSLNYVLAKIKYQPTDKDIIYLNNYYFSRKTNSADIKYIKMRTK